MTMLEATPTRPDWAIGPYCELLAVKPTRTVRISARAALVIRDEFEGFYKRSLYGMDEETGGCCLGRRQVPDRDIEILEAGTPGSDTETGYGWLRLGVESLLDLRSKHDQHGLVEVATWHSHPPGYAAQPSRADLRAWQSNLEFARKSYGRQVGEFVGLIASGMRGHNLRPELNAWIITDHGHEYGYATAAPAHLELIDDAPARCIPSNGRDRISITPTYGGGGGVVTSRIISGNIQQRSDGTQVIDQPMAIATRSFTATYDGEPVQIRAGVTRVVTDHELARRHSNDWKSLPSVM
jgi:Prokaryotic homologs of the JAB domain